MRIPIKFGIKVYAYKNLQESTVFNIIFTKLKESVSIVLNIR